MRGAAVALAILALAPCPARGADAAAGEAVYGRCRPCHQIGESAKNSVGPPLNGILGRPAAAVEGYSYSAALRGSGLTWDEATLRSYIEAPRTIVPETRMAFAGLTEAADLDDVIAYLKQFGPDGRRATHAPAE